MTTKETFALKLYELRDSRGISRQQLADELQITRSSLEFYEKAKRTPDIDMIVKIAGYFHVSVDYLFGLTNVQSTSSKTKDICEHTGLSEKAVETLYAYQDYFQSEYLLPTINLMIEQASPPLYYSPSDLTDEEMGEEWQVWKSQEYVNVLSDIENYFKVNLKTPSVTKVLENGDLKVIKGRKSDGALKWNDLILNSVLTIKTDQIVESALLDEIVNSLKELKKKERWKKMSNRHTPEDDFGDLSKEEPNAQHNQTNE